MGVDRTGDGTDRDAENAENPPAKEAPWRPPPDRPGSPEQPSRLESRAAASGREGPTEPREDRDDDRPGEEPERQAGEDQRSTQSDNGEIEADEPAADELSGVPAPESAEREPADRSASPLGEAPGKEGADETDRQFALGAELAENADKKVDAEIDETLDKVNPKFDWSQSAYSENCTSVVQANELRRRGSEVEAGPLEKPLRKDEGGPGGRVLGAVERVWGGEFTAGTEAEIVDASAEPGARGAVYIAWKHGGGHVFNVENVGGKVRFIDGQPTPPVLDASHYFALGKDTHYLRFDNRPAPADSAIKRFLEP